MDSPTPTPIPSPSCAAAAEPTTSPPPVRDNSDPPVTESSPCSARTPVLSTTTTPGAGWAAGRTTSPGDRAHGPPPRQRRTVDLWAARCAHRRGEEGPGRPAAAGQSARPGRGPLDWRRRQARHRPRPAASGPPNGGLIARSLMASTHPPGHRAAVAPRSSKHGSSEPWLTSRASPPGKSPRRKIPRRASSSSRRHRPEPRCPPRRPRTRPAAAWWRAASRTGGSWRRPGGRRCAAHARGRDRPWPRSTLTSRPAAGRASSPTRGNTRSTSLPGCARSHSPNTDPDPRWGSSRPTRNRRRSRSGP